MLRYAGRLPRCVRGGMVLIAAAALVGWSDADQQQESNFARTTIDVGIVTSDLDKSLDFYKNALGFTEAGTFRVPAEMGRDSGLSDNQPFTVHMLVLGGDETATKIKLMEFARAPGERQDVEFIHSTYGYSYLTIYVKDIDAAVARAEKHGVKPLAKGPTAVPESIAQNTYLAVVRDPDGNMIELVGPRAESVTPRRR